MSDEEAADGFPNLIVVLVGPEEPGNIGFTVRAMANFGVDRLRIVGDDVREDQYAQIFAVRAVDILERAEIFETLEGALVDVEAAWGPYIHPCDRRTRIRKGISRIDQR